MSNTTNKQKLFLLLKYWYLLVVLVFIGSILAERASAITMSNDNYVLQMGSFNMASGRSKDKKLSFTAGQTAPGLYTGKNYKVRAGFQYLSKSMPFTFSISETSIDFGIIAATEPVTRTTELTVSGPSGQGYSVRAYENHELLSTSPNAFIPDTTCDNGSCSELTPAPWKSTLTYGFGYRCNNVAGKDCPSGFSPEYYKSFANIAKSKDPQIIMKGLDVKTDKKVKITYKINISSTQPTGEYTNLITYIVSPAF